MKIIDLEQGSSAWHEFRGMHIGASDAACIMGCGFKSALKLWQEKLGLIEPEPMNAAMRRGVAMEEEARQWACKELGIEFIPTVIKSDEHPWRAASLDGLSACKTKALEIKCPKEGGKAHKEALKGLVVNYYIPQLQHQYMASDGFITHLWYAVYLGNNDGIIIKVEKDDDYCTTLHEKELQFKTCLDNLVAPTGSKKERDDEEWQKLATEAASYKSQELSAKSGLSNVRQRAVELSGGESCTGFGLTMQLVRGNGSYDWDAINMAAGCDVRSLMDMHKLEGKPSWRMNIKK